MILRRLLVTGCLGTRLLHGQAPEKNPDSAVGTWLASHNISIRRTFDGSKDEQKPATLTWANHDTTDGTSYSDVHLGVKVAEWEPLPDLLVYPVFEWHRTTTAKDPLHKLSGKLGVEYRPISLADSPLVPVLYGALSYARDYEKRTWKTTANILLGPTGDRAWWPGTPTRNTTNTRMFRYYVYAGVEYYDKLPLVMGQPLYVALGRAQAELHFLRSAAADPWQPEIAQLTFEYAYRRRMSGEEGLDRRLARLAVEFAWFLDRKSHVALAFRYQRGDDPLADFAYSEQSSIGIAAKF